MATQDAVTLRCEKCGHSWKGRNTPGTARQCSKCRSRKIVVVGERDLSSDNEKGMLGLLYLQKRVIEILYLDESISEEEYGYLDGCCPWCAEDSMEHETADDNTYLWKCRKCGRKVP
jgi:uncharacterized Zn finger protein